VYGEIARDHAPVEHEREQDRAESTCFPNHKFTFL